jgi:hypothetical protein
VETHTYNLQTNGVFAGYHVIVAHEDVPDPQLQQHQTGGIWLCVKRGLADHVTLLKSDRHMSWFKIDKLLPLPVFLAIAYLPQASQVSEHIRIYEETLKKGLFL